MFFSAMAHEKWQHHAVLIQTWCGSSQRGLRWQDLQHLRAKMARGTNAIATALEAQNEDGPRRIYQVATMGSCCCAYHCCYYGRVFRTTKPNSWKSAQEVQAQVQHEIVFAALKHYN